MSLSPTWKRALFTAITIAVPVLFFALLEGALRLVGAGEVPAAFVTPANADGRWLAARADVARRYFPDDPSPPTPPVDLFLREKPPAGFRVFVLGESTTAGFPYPANGAFADIIEDGLRDALPDATVEVINLGIPATNTYTILDLLPEILAQAPDAIIIYAGHNEYYGALGAASSARIARSPAATRVLLKVRRLRTAQLMGRLLRPLASPPPSVARAPGRMEELATDAGIPLGGQVYTAGVRQFEHNLSSISAAVTEAGIPLFIGSLASNIRDFRPFAAGTSIDARALFDSASALARRGDPAAPGVYAAARDADPIRFRAPTAFNDVVRSIAGAGGATYVPVAERLADASNGAPGNALFFEHVHPRPDGVVMIADAFLDALLDHPGFRGRVQRARLRPAGEYRDRMVLTDLDSAIADLLVASLMQRWPFVPHGRATDHLATVIPATAVDSLALQVLTGQASWTQAKLGYAGRLAASGKVAAALAEYSGLMRNQPWNESPFRFAGRMLLDAGQPEAAEPLLHRAHALEPTAFSAFALALIASRADSTLARAEALLQESLRLAPAQPQVLYQLSLTHGRLGNLPAARATAQQVAQIAPAFPGLQEWLRVLGVR